MDDIFSKIGTGLTLSQKIERKVEEAIRQKKLLPGMKIAVRKRVMCSVCSQPHCYKGSSSQAKRERSYRHQERKRHVYYRTED